MSAKAFNLNGEDYIMIKAEVFNELVANSNKLTMLEAYGVDNWIGYGDAMSDYYSNLNENEDED